MKDTMLITLRNINTNEVFGLPCYKIKERFVKLEYIYIIIYSYQNPTWSDLKDIWIIENIEVLNNGD